jgi:uncharacterized protein
MTQNIGGGQGAGRGAAAGLLCPVCRVDLVMSERLGVEIDYCPRCRGVWLDRGELDKILDRGAAELSPPPQIPPQASRQPPPGEYRRDHDDDRDRGHYRQDDYKYHKHRRRSFLDDLFDFD